MKNILIVEDDNTSNLLYQTYLKDKFNVFSVYDTANIYELIKKNNIDLILLDLKIAPDNGFIVAQKVRQESPNIKIIAQTAHLKHLHENDKNFSNFDIYLEKPISLETLLKSIKSLLK